MDDELRRWAATWKQVEAFDMDIVRRAKSAYRTEGMRLSIEVLTLGVGAVFLLTGSAWLLSRGDVSVANWTRLGLAWSVLVIGSVITRHSWRQRSESRERLSDRPQSLVTDLVRVHERELQAWVNKLGLAFTVFLSAVGLVSTGSAAMEAMATGKSSVATWGPLGFLVWALLAFGVFGRRRVRFLRRELRSLRDIQRELGATDRDAS